MRARLVAVCLLASQSLACRHETPPPGDPDVVRAPRPVPAISGGTLLVTTDQRFAIVSDPDRDRISVVDVRARRLVRTIELHRFDEPGRATQDDRGRVHVALRRSGEVFTLTLPHVDAPSGAPYASDEVRTTVCPAPRGVAFDQARGELHVACAGGELVSLSADTLEPTRVLSIARDLRDVHVSGDALVVSRFRSAELLVVGQDGVVQQQLRPKVYEMKNQQRFVPHVAWRTVAHRDGSVAMVHQRALENELTHAPEYYRGVGCDNSVVQTTISSFADLSTTGSTTGPSTTESSAAGLSSAELIRFANAPLTAPIPRAAVPVDLALSRDGSELSILSAANGRVYRVRRGALEAGQVEKNECDLGEASPTRELPDGPVALAYVAGDELLIQTRDPAALVFHADGGRIELGGESVFDTGHDLFHRIAGEVSPIACASCHPEGGDDGHVWNVDVVGPRRTQTLRGGLLATLPLHWDGDFADTGAIMNEVLATRMGGEPVGPGVRAAFDHWVDALPRVPISPSPDPDARARGQALFESEEVGCAECHSGPRLTDNRTLDVGTGGPFQVPSLRNLALRAPYMHDGCAETLADRFSSCGGDERHGRTAHLDAAQRADLVVYLESL